jgi:tetratricopeptide (TPR) repeat protein
MDRAQRLRGISAVLAVLAAALALVSCVSQRERRLREFTEAPLFGMVYDYDQKPCPAAAVHVDGQERARTDIDGRFVIVDLSRGEHRVGVRKPGYEELELEVQFLNRDQILYLRIISLRQLLEVAEAALEKKRLAETASLLDRARKIDPGDPVGVYLKALYLLETGAVDEAVLTLEGLAGSGYREAILYLSLADIYQYRLGDPARAAENLRVYLELQQDPDVRKRLEALAQEK